MSQQSEGVISDIFSDVDKFIEENNIQENVIEFMTADSPEQEYFQEDEQKPTHVDLFGDENSHKLSTIRLSTNDITKFPPAEPSDLCIDEYSGPYGFDVCIIPDGIKPSWEFSPKLNKIFIKLYINFPVAFSIKHRPDYTNLFIRATPVYSQSHYFQEIVYRCVQHEHPKDPSNLNLPEHILGHIIRCSNHQTQYFGSREDGIRLNIIIPLGLPQTGTDMIKDFYQFVCKNSCTSGMNRRPIDVIFTLEDENGTVFGRKVIAVRICSSPKRDRMIEENNNGALNGQQPSRGKKRKVNNNNNNKVEDAGDYLDTKEYSININVVGKKNYQQALKTCRDLMAGEIVKLQEANKMEAIQPFRKCFEKIDALLNKTK